MVLQIQLGFGSDLRSVLCKMTGNGHTQISRQTIIPTGARVNPVIQENIALYCIIQANNGLTFGATGIFRLFVKVS